MAGEVGVRGFGGSGDGETRRVGARIVAVAVAVAMAVAVASKRSGHAMIQLE